jgi:6-methylpretetramide 4-monooxygenase / 4-hydroxy-6-methylpretetramide 12a-monooxygenase
VIVPAGNPSDVLVIGAGPSGLFAAIELARQGVAVRLIEQALRPHCQARATSIQPGTLEILDAIGLLRQFLEVGERVGGFCVYGSDMAPLSAMTFAGIDCRFDFLCSLPQYETERILESHLVSLGGAVERGISATRIEPEAGGVRVELVHSQGAVETICPSVVIGAGGAHGVTRSSLGASLEGITYAGQFLVADIAMQSPLPRDRSNVVCGPQGPLLLAPLPGGRWISFLEWADTAVPVTAADVALGIEVRLGGRCRPTDVSWFSSFRSHRRMVPQLADGQRFLVGDAGHMSSPFGGEGLNAGMHDAFDLAWKLALVRRAEALRSLLETFATERLIADRHVLDTSDQAHRMIFALADAVRQGRGLPASADPLAIALLRNARAMIDVDYAGSPIVADYGPVRDRDASPHPGQRYSDWTKLGATGHHVLVFGPVVAHESLTRLERRWSPCVRIICDNRLDGSRAGVPRGGLVLIRPDGHIGFRALATDADALAALDRHLGTYLIPNSSRE